MLKSKRYFPLSFIASTVLSVCFPFSTDSANLTVVKNTLQSSRISAVARVDATGTFDGSSNVLIKTAGSAPSFTTSTANFRAGDSLVIGTGTYTIVGITDADEFSVSTVLAVGDGTPITITIGNTNGSNTPIAPAPSASHTQATADTYTFQVKNYDNINAVVDSTSGKIAVIESVRVTATVDPTISFSITGVTSGANPCGTGATNQTDIDTTTGTNAPLAVPFGTLALKTFKDAAHLLTVSTNAANGYTVTAQENDQLGKDGGTTPFIPDADGDNGTGDETTSDTWDTATGNPGFGYTLKSISGSTVPFTSTGATFNMRRFPSVADPDSPLVSTIMSNTTTADSNTANVCYRISVDATQAAGDYENQITYTATASF